MSSLQSLRVCRRCGLVAYTKEDLELFRKHRGRLHDRDNLCKSCFNKYRKDRRDTDDRVYLRHKYQNLRNRCYNSNHTLYYRYGAIGITVCDEWLSNPESFVEWALSSGFKRELEIDRINNRGPYNPNNCKWSTRLEQQRNRRNTVTFPDKGTRICCRCKLEKPLTDFHVDRKAPQGRTYVCKECRNKETKNG